MDLNFFPIDLDYHSPLCVAFAEDLDMSSFGSAEQLYGEDGKGAECRQRGYGRQLLAATMQLMLAEGHRHFALDVATDNARALTLYETGGFCETEAYDYYDVALTAPGGSDVA